MSRSSEASGESGGLTLLIARMLICWIFVHSALGQIVAFSYWTERAAQKSVPLAAAAITCSIVIQLVGGLAVLVGAETRIATWALVLFLIPTSLIMHDYWTLQGAARDTQQNNFMRNMAIMGGLLVLGRFGAGYYSVDAFRAAKRFAGGERAAALNAPKQPGRREPA